MQWISVKDRLPDANVPVIVCDRGTMQGTAVLCGEYEPDAQWRSGTKWNIYLDGGPLHEVTHWMELPELPKEL